MSLRERLNTIQMSQPSGATILAGAESAAYRAFVRRADPRALLNWAEEA